MDAVATKSIVGSRSVKESGEQTTGAVDEQIVVFTIGSEEFGVDISRVWEINELQTITRVPRAPKFIEGIINLRGEIIPVLNLGKQLGLFQDEAKSGRRIMVVQSGQNRLGLMVDEVRQVIQIPAGAVEPPSPLVTTIDSGYLRGIARLEGRLVILFDLDMLLSAEEKESVEAVHAAMA